jgi:hypothetical protein
MHPPNALSKYAIMPLHRQYSYINAAFYKGKVKQSNSRQTYCWHTLYPLNGEHATGIIGPEPNDFIA